MSKYATVTVHVNPAPGAGKILGQFVDLREGDYLLVPAGEGLLTVEEVMEIHKKAASAFYSQRRTNYPLTKKDIFFAALAAHAQPGEEGSDRRGAEDVGWEDARRKPSLKLCLACSGYGSAAGEQCSLCQGSGHVPAEPGEGESHEADA